jgi:uncharacterized membrane protein YhaH (DUF805 family)
MIEHAGVGAPPRKLFWWVAGRAGRREYWVHVALLLALGLALEKPPIVNLALTVVLTLLQVRRVHDFGRSAWLAVGATLAPLAAMPVMLVASEDVAWMVGLAIEVALICWIGAVPGATGDNRFGPPPPFTLKRVLTAR